MRQVWLIEPASGLPRQVETDGRHPKDAGEDVVGARVTAVPRRGDLVFEKLNSARTAWVDNLSAVETDLVQRVNDEREAKQMERMTPGGAKKTIYAAKEAEVQAWFSLANTVGGILTAFNLLPTDARKRRFRYMLQEVELTGDLPATVIARFQAGADASQNAAARVEAIAQKTIAQIRSATTAAAKRAAFNNRNWKA